MLSSNNYVDLCNCWTACMYVHVCEGVCVCVYACVWVCVCVCMHMCVCMRACMYVFNKEQDHKKWSMKEDK